MITNFYSVGSRNYDAGNFTGVSTEQISVQGQKIKEQILKKQQATQHAQTPKQPQQTAPAQSSAQVQTTAPVQEETVCENTNTTETVDNNYSDI
ncbi:hypothetical protein IJJ97_05020, partial [bacterium]|nr:hypothetical protein [bacterium]